MKKLWRKTADLFLKHPVLWLPYLGANWLVSCLKWLRGFASERILDWCPTSHTLFGTAYQNCSGSIGFRIELIRFMRAGFQYADHCVFTVMLVVIAMIAGSILRGQRPTMKLIADAPRPSASRILAYSLKIWFLSLVLEVLTYESSNLSAERLNRGYKWMWTAFTTGQSLLSMVCYVWIMTPLAMALLRPAGEGAASDEEKRLGRGFLILAAVPAYAMGSLLFPLLSAVPIFASKTIVAFTDGILSPVFRFPNLLGDVALVLLASREDWRSAECRPFLQLRKLLQGLMPLHSFERDEQL